MGERWFGRAKASRPVDECGTADGAALEDSDGLVFRLAGGGFLVKLAVGLAFVELEIARGIERAFLDDDDLDTGFGEDACRRAATGAAADDGDVGFEGSAFAKRG